MSVCGRVFCGLVMGGVMVFAGGVAASGEGQGEVGFVMTPQRVVEVKAVRLAFVEVKTALAGGQLSKDVKAAMEKVKADREAGKIVAVGGPVAIFEGLMTGRMGEIVLKVGFPVAAGAKVPEGYQVVDLPAYKAATFVYSGSAAQHQEALRQAMTEFTASGEKAEGALREMYLYWEGEASPNNVILIEIGVK